MRGTVWLPRPHPRVLSENMEYVYSDDDSDEEFRFDAAPRYVVPSYYHQLYSSHNLVPGAENDDDGWHSDDESCLPDLPQAGIQTGWYDVFLIHATCITPNLFNK